jgi:hypothetical protein
LEISNVDLVGGIYKQVNLVKSKRYTLRDWRLLSEQSEHITPGWSEEHKRIRYAPSSPTKNKRKRGEKTDSPDVIEQLTVQDYLPSVPFPSDQEYWTELERHYWKNVTFMPPLYGADIRGTLFDESVQHWNIGKLSNLLNQVTVKMPGVNSPYLYVGMWKSTFAWHVEDMDLFSINYIHFGAPKQWYVIPSEYRQKFEQVEQSLFPAEAKSCSEFLRHKNVLISPSTLAHYSIPLHRCVQEAGEIILTFPNGYHAGFNLGYNCAESVNFATERWVDIGKMAKSCACVVDSVRIDVAGIFNSGDVTDQQVISPPKKSAGSKSSASTCVLCGKCMGELLEVEGKPRLRIHRVCAAWLPETDVRVNPETGNPIVVGYDAIGKSRRKLQCKFCQYKVGACVQCYDERCLVAFHPTCALQRDLSYSLVSLDVLNNQGGIEHINHVRCFCVKHDPVSFVPD